MKRPQQAATIVAAAFTIAAFAAPAVYGHGKEKHNNKPVEEPVVLAPGYQALTFDAPTAGSYTLATLGTAGDGDILTSSGERTSLAALMEGKVTVLSFIYRACNDVNGCPLATYVLHQVRQQLAFDNELGTPVQLVSMSFDPVNDTPEAMREYRASFGGDDTANVDWRFVTAPDEAALLPILDDYNQPLSRSALEDDTVVINHMLRVFLVDSHRQVRNIYSASFLHADTLVNDIRTIIQEGQVDPAGTTIASASTSRSTSNLLSGTLTEPENRDGYASGEYVSQSVTLERDGNPADLMSLATSTVQGLPALPDTGDLSAGKIALGRQLFFDRRLSINDTFSCAMCHIPQQAFTSNELATSVGVEGRTVKRNAPTLLNVGYLSSLFHDGRESRLEQQVWSPLLAHNEMANPSIGYVLDKVAAIDDYRRQFSQVYGSENPGMHSMGDALAAYQRSLIAGNSAFDQWYYGGDSHAVSAQVKQGFELFKGQGGCSNCHLVGESSALFTDQQLHNTGIGYARSMYKRDKPHAVTLAPGVVIKIDPKAYADAAEKPPNDLGRYEVTLMPEDRWKFRTPTLRNVALTAPYMHDGSLGSLAEVIEFYDQGGIDNPVLSPLMQPLGLDDAQKAALLAFLNSLNGDSVSMLISDGMAAPIGDTTAARN